MEPQTAEHLERAEKAEHAAHSGSPMLIRVSMTIAVLAVLAASVGSLETLESGVAISDKNESVLLQNQATDNWAFFQAQSIKKNMYDLAATSNADKAAEYGPKARDYEREGAEARRKAEELEKGRDDKLLDSNAHEHRHHVLTVAVTLLHVSIAVATIAIITGGRRWPWYAAMLLGAVGTGVAGFAYVG